MARKPLLGGPVLNREDVQSRLAGDDLMSRVIENDAVKHGRASPTPEASTPGASTPEAPEAAPESEEAQPVNKLASQQYNNIVNNLTDEDVSQQTGMQEVRGGVTDRKGVAKKGVAKREDTGDGVGRTPPPDPLTQAYLTTLSQPFPPADAKAPRVLVAGRVQPEVGERFELACALLRKRGDKQDVLNRALQVFIEHVVAHGGDVEI